MAVLLMVTAAGFVVTGGAAEASRKTTVGRAQYKIMIRQCRYSNTPALRKKCRAAVKTHYRIGRRNNPRLDCRAYSGIVVCGKLMLSRNERRCVTRAVRAGVTRRRAEVECYAFA
ncbi:hypothetical protein [Sphaerisporangium perillae]|uniref:hypothetical protein n=1 Tax=Sphaerisporangium perillae TaxID=2935860 RepID=UPI00200D66B0|nr:hypothetical protein [Sphaerisporangium perillae]